MFFVLCFLYCFFAIVLGAYLGLELISVRKTARVYRTMLKATRQGAGAMSVLADVHPNPVSPGESNYFAK